MQCDLLKFSQCRQAPAVMSSTDPDGRADELSAPDGRADELSADELSADELTQMLMQIATWLLLCFSVVFPTSDPESLG